MAKTLRVEVTWNSGQGRWQLSDAEGERHNTAYRAMWSKWKADPDVQFISYFLEPQICHHMLLEVTSVAKIDEMDQDVMDAFREGMTLETFNMQLVLGNTEFDEWLAE
jgi:hypothetical protein